MNNEHDLKSLSSFLDALTRASRTHKIGITGEPILFVMEDDDFERIYTSDTESKLQFDQTSLTLNLE